MTLPFYDKYSIFEFGMGISTQYYINNVVRSYYENFFTILLLSPGETDYQFKSSLFIYDLSKTQHNSLVSVMDFTQFYHYSTYSNIILSGNR